MAHPKQSSDDTGTTVINNDQNMEMSPIDSEFQDASAYGDDSPTTEDSSPRVYPPVIPPEHSNRTLILCFDGTGDQFSTDNSNIVQLVSLLAKGDGKKQLVYYQAGIGTYTSHVHATPFMLSIYKTLDESVAWSINTHVMGGYEFLMQNYVAGDKICIFGFSRGAYTARSLAGMLAKVGLLPPGNVQQVPFAYKMFTRTDHVGWEQSREFKKTFSANVSIEFLGVWDTVSSLGLIPKSLPVTTPCTMTRTFRHALSLDERRVKFEPNFWKEREVHLKNHHNDAAQITKTDAEEVWFTGCHGDVGGSTVSNKTRHSLARISLRWMIRECFKTNSGIMFNSDSLFKIGLDPSTLYPFVAPRPRPLPVGFQHIQEPPAVPIPKDIPTLLKKQSKQSDLLAGSEIPFLGSEEEEELRDALSPVYDQLKLAKAWWILEVIPLLQAFRRGYRIDRWVKGFRPHFGAPRIIPHQKSNGLKVHRSVNLRMQAAYEDESARQRGKKYVPSPRFDVEPTWVD